MWRKCIRTFDSPNGPRAMVTHWAPTPSTSRTRHTRHARHARHTRHEPMPGSLGVESFGLLGGGRRAVFVRALLRPSERAASSPFRPGSAWRPAGRSGRSARVATPAGLAVAGRERVSPGDEELGPGGGANPTGFGGVTCQVGSHLGEDCAWEGREKEPRKCIRFVAFWCQGGSRECLLKGVEDG